MVGRLTQGVLRMLRLGLGPEQALLRHAQALLRLCSGFLTLGSVKSSSSSLPEIKTEPAKEKKFVLSLWVVNPDPLSFSSAHLLEGRRRSSGGKGGIYGRRESSEAPTHAPSFIRRLLTALGPTCWSSSANPAGGMPGPRSLHFMWQHELP
jgi:hypothetical protein